MSSSCIELIADEARSAELAMRSYTTRADGIIILLYRQTRYFWCCVVLCCVVLCCAVLCCVVLCCAVLCCAVLCCVVLCCVVLCCVVLCCVVLCCVVLCCVVLCCVVLCCVVKQLPDFLLIHFSKTFSRFVFSLLIGYEVITH